MYICIIPQVKLVMSSNFDKKGITTQRCHRRMWRTCYPATLPRTLKKRTQDAEGWRSFTG